MVMLEGLSLEVSEVPKWQLAAAWRTLSKKPMPNVRALQLSDNDFEHVLEHRSCIEDKLREIEEWGRVLSYSGTDACIFNAEEGDGCKYVILIRANPYHSLDEIILHELGHLARGDL